MLCTFRLIRASKAAARTALLCSLRYCSSGSSDAAPTTFINGMSDSLLLSTSMAWTKSGATQAQLADNLRKSGAIQTDTVLQAFRAVDRAAFVPRGGSGAYENRPCSIGFGATISTPQIHATALELLHDKLQPGVRVLDVGSGSGYLTALMAEVLHVRGSADKRCSVIGLEYVPQLVAQARESARVTCAHLLHSQLLQFEVGDGREGLSSCAPFDVIHVGAAVTEAAVRNTLLAQLSPGGRLLLPWGAGAAEQRLVVLDKAANGSVAERAVTSVVFSPLGIQPPAGGAGRTRAQRLQELQQELAGWREAFERKHGRRPSRTDMFADAEATSAFKEYSRLSKWRNQE